MHENETSAVHVEPGALKTAAINWASPELDRIAVAVITDLKKRPPMQAFGDLAARHLWDEYCWNFQEGPLGADFDLDGTSLGSLGSAFEDLAWTAVLTELDHLPRHIAIFLSAIAFELEPQFAEGDSTSTLGAIWPEGMAKLVMERVNPVASRRCLDLIGCDRADCIQSEASGSGIVWAFLLERGEAWEIAAEYVDDLVDPESDLQPLADALVEGFLSAAASETGHSALSDLFLSYEDELRHMLYDGALNDLNGMRATLLKSLDG